MLWLVLGGLVLFAFWGGLRAFERASVTTVKSLVAWIAALGGISLALLLILSGRGGIAIAALVEVIRDRAVADSRLTGTANLLVMPSLDAANISFTLLKAASDGLPVGPILLGMSKPIHVVVPSVTARGIVNLSALAALEAQELEAQALEATSASVPALD